MDRDVPALVHRLASGCLRVHRPEGPREFYTDAPGWIVESESDVRVGGVAVTITDRS